MHVIICGGSLVGLMHGIMLKHHGYTVDIFEQSLGPLEGQAAGVSTGSVVKDFLVQHDRVKTKIDFSTRGIQEVNTDGQIERVIPIAMGQTTWDALYFRLRANFDGYKSVFSPEPPAPEPGDGSAEYSTGRKVLSAVKGGDDVVAVTYKDLVSGKNETVNADLVIAADGANSVVRSLLSPHATGRQYPGYVMWRGIIPEKGLSTQTTSQTSEWFSFCVLPRIREYICMYPVPSDTGSLQKAESSINFAWYSHISGGDLSEALTSVDGHKHKWSVPQGKLNPSVWQKQLREKGDNLNPACSEIAARIERPFLQVVGDHTAPRANFMNGHVLLVGDALVTLRPHTGFGTSSGAFHALRLEDALFGDKVAGKDHVERMSEWEREVLEFSHMERLKSISWGEYYLGGWLSWLLAAVNYHGRIKLKEWRVWGKSFF